MSGARTVFGGSSRPVEISLGLFGCNVVGYTAREPKAASLKQLCTNGHPPQAITMPTTCATCGEVARETLARGREVGKGTWVVVSQEDVAKLKDVSAFQNVINLDVVPAEDVEATTRYGDKTYYLAPPEKANPMRFTVIRDLIAKRTDKAFVGLFAVRTAVSTFRFTVVKDTLVMQELVTAEAMKEAPVVVPSSYAEGTLEAASAWVDQNVAADFDPTRYVDQASARLEAYLDQLQAVDGATGVLPAAPEIPVVDQAAEVLDFFTKSLQAAS
ncbi:MAG: Ku protein [Oryzihumus sp.]